MRISDWSSDVCSADLQTARIIGGTLGAHEVDVALRHLIDPASAQRQQLLGMALVVACAAIPADHGALHVRRADLLGARHQRRDAMPGVALWIITVDADQSDQRIAIMMPIGRASCRERVCQYG